MAHYCFIVVTLRANVTSIVCDGERRRAFGSEASAKEYAEKNLSAYQTEVRRSIYAQGYMGY